MTIKDLLHAILADRARLERDGSLPDIGLKIVQTETFYLDPKATEPQTAVGPVPSPGASATSKAA